MTIVEWARTADLTKPLRWGDVKHEVLSRKPAPEARAGLKLIVLARVGLVAVVRAGLVALSPPVVVGFLAVELSDPDVEATGDLLRPAIFFSALKCLVLISLLWAWWSTRRDRSLVFVLYGEFGALASAVTLFVMSPSQVGLVITSLVVGGVGPRSRRGPRSAVLELRYWETRKLVLARLPRRRSAPLAASVSPTAGTSVEAPAPASDSGP